MKYWAFVTYSHADSHVAGRLHHALENYRVPNALVGRTVNGRQIPNRLRPIFIDRAELAGASDLSHEIKQALTDSHALVVLCSPSSAESRWVNREIELFQDLGRSKKIFAVITAEGATEPLQFPAALLHQKNADGSVSTVEPLAADLRREKDGFRDGKLKIIAGILDVSFDSLKQRDLARRQRRQALATIAGLLILMLMTATYIGLADSGAPLLAGGGIRRTLDEHELSLFRRAASETTIAQTASTLRRTLVAEALNDLDKPDQVLRFTPEGRVGGTWELGQIVASIAHAPESTAADLSRAKRWLEVPFEPGRASESKGVSYGWLWFQLKNPQAEAALWPIIGLSSMLSRKDALKPEERLRFIQHLRYAQRAALHYHRSTDGAWDHLPNQAPPGQSSLYTTLTALEAMIAVREANETWPDEGGADRLSQMIAKTAAYLIDLYDREGEWRNRPGWHGSQNERQVTPVASLTLLSYFILLRAAAFEPESVRLSAEMLSDIGRRISTLPSEGSPFATDLDRVEAEFRDLDGIQRRSGYNFHVPWFPYAVACANEWLRHLKNDNAPRADIVAARRVLGELILNYGKEVATTRKDFYRAENLFRLDLIAASP
jgi:hypothetical protein